ncbi:MAG: Rhodanese-like protein [Ramlibacter sp.]|jgi:rhodanese-related sulfurtransferase|uniref:rhodanese-like domain-containing protein n=1 Tax=Ramlibacter sp. TaxID=1917967 RepID=UPI002623D2C6|nr:rhodanese-like domain-containing protein [Ramlibacter sp.]MDB5753398.1 Rhodanese-like protein [Ramlibacter sp.]
MKFLLDNWALILVAVVSAGMLMWPALGRGVRAGGVSANGAVQLINREKGVVIDVSEAEEFAVQHIGGSRNIPVNQLQQRLPELVKNKALPVILVCASGARAQRSLAVAKSLGYARAVALSGGLKGWKEANLPLEKA